MTIHPSWNKLFNRYEFNLDLLETQNTKIFPPKEHIFRVFEMDVMNIKICLLGQDVYHSENQANGFAFSVNRNVKIPPSLRNIFKELQNNFPERQYKFSHGDLQKWVTTQNIFLLNSSLTVEEGKPSSHIPIWEEFTDDVIKFISKNNENCVFLLLGNFAKSKNKFIENKTRIIEAPHPSPLARGFIGSDVFKKVEKILGKQIDWQN